jgi:hypothetical protein
MIFGNWPMMMLSVIVDGPGTWRNGERKYGHRMQLYNSQTSPDATAPPSKTGVVISTPKNVMAMIRGTVLVSGRVWAGKNRAKQLASYVRVQYTLLIMFRRIVGQGFDFMWFSGWVCLQFTETPRGENWVLAQFACRATQLS